jgi:radical SAM protein with 4Fe4S-binding SPASM domain
MFAALRRLGCRKLTISGGEPTLRPDFVELVALAKAAGLRVSVITNTLLWKAPLPAEAKRAGLESVGMSVDGLGSIHDQIRGRAGHFETLLMAMQASRDVGLPWAAVTFVNNYNLELLPQMYDLLTEQGAFAWQIQLGTDMGNMRHNRDLLLSARRLPRLDEILTGLVKRKGLRVDVSDSIGYYGPNEALLRSSAVRNRVRRTFGGCSAGLRVLGIESNGNVKGCLSIMAGYNEEGCQFVEGNLRRESLADIWNRQSAFAYNRQFEVDQLSGFCRECRHAATCRGGCYGKRVAFGDPSDNPLCLYRVLCETSQNRSKMGQVAAAALLATTLGGGVGACHEAKDPEPTPSDSNDPVSTQTDYSAPSTDTDQPTNTDYSAPSTDATDATELDYSTPWTDDTGTLGTETVQNDYSDPQTDDTSSDTHERFPIMSGRPPRRRD